MRKKTAKRRSQVRRRSSSPESFIITRRYLVVFAVIVLLVIAKFGADSSVLGSKSALIAQVPDGAPADGSGAGSGGGGAAPPPDNGGGGQSAPAPEQPQQPSANNAPQAPQQQQQSGGSWPAQNSAPQQQNFNQQSQPRQQNFQPQGNSGSGGGQSNMQQNPSQGPGQYSNRGSNQQNGNQSNFNSGSSGQGQGQFNPNNPDQGTGQGNMQPGFAGSSGPTREQIQQFQQRYFEEASKNGFQISGQAPTQLLERSEVGRSGESQNTEGNFGNTGNNQARFSQTGQSGQQQFQALPSTDDFPSIVGKFDVKLANGNQNINLNEAHTRISWGGTNQGAPLMAIRSDRAQVPLTESSFEEINTAIKLTTGSEVSQSGDKFLVKRGDVEAQTQLPVSFNMTTKTFTVQTQSGQEQEIHVLPDQAVQKLIENKTLTSIEGTGENGSVASVKLTELNNQPVYEVAGNSQQKFLGFVPVSISKTTFVSAQTGDLVESKTNFFSQILDTVSF